jgi:hypothetical protein
MQNDFRAYGTFGANYAPILYQDYHCLQMDRNPLPLEDHHLGVPLGASKMIYESTVLLVQPCTYLALTLTLSPNRPKRASS